LAALLHIADAAIARRSVALAANLPQNGVPAA
jgi:hypothetical protein